ncbi:hypothetical protein BTO05_11000 [Winogradskyella sp. PC-19]|uniref:TolC family protein n=1 Tax=Winogradskyella sp. PC-19 TaxID=754417 RepID=UPI000B3BEBD2|nr:TolC family protein [Winogradskyella sp. PC-19]ARV10138.1 hypothetical protein BTO05_11000 [Winogradskyella sp. PC-19]
MKKITYLLFCFTISSFAQKKWTLEDCINHAKTNNIDIAKQQNQNQSFAEDVKVAKGNYYPDLNFNASQGYSLGNSFNVSTGVGQRESRFNSFSLSSSLNVFSGFLNKYTLNKAKLTEQKGKLDIDVLALDLSINITNNYLTVLFNKEILEVAKEQVKISALEEKRLGSLYSQALTGKNEYLQLQSTFASDKKEVLIAENNLKTSLIKLRELLDINLIQDFDVEDISLSDFESSAFNTEIQLIIKDALEVNPQLKSAEINQKISEQDIKIAKSNFYPKLNFSYNYGSNYFGILGEDDVVFDQTTMQFIDNGFFVQLDNNRTHFLSLNLSVPIFNRFKTKSNYNKSKFEAETRKIELENQKNELKNKVEIAYNDLLTAKATLEASKVAASTQEEAFNIVSEKYKDALISNFDFLESKSNYIKTQSELVKAKYDYLFKIKVLEYYSN